MTQGLCGNCGTGLPYGSGRCARCGLAAMPVAPQAPAHQSNQGYAPPGWLPYAQPHPAAVGRPPFPPGTQQQPAAVAGHAGGPYGTADHGTAPHGTSPYGPAYGAVPHGGQGAPPPGWGALEAFFTGDWLGAARSAALAVLAMLGVSLVGMLMIAGGELGFGETLVLVLGGVCLAVGGDAFVEAQAESFGESGGASVSVGILPLTITLVGLLVLGVTFARRLRRRGVARGRDVLFQMGRTALLFMAFFLPLSLLSRYTPDPFGDSELRDLIEFEGELGVGVGSSLSGALLFAVAATGLVALLRPSAPLLGRFRPRVFPALMGAVAVFAAGALAAAIFVVWGLVDIGGDEGLVQFLGASVLSFVNGMLAAVLWAAGVPLTGEGGFASELTTSQSNSESVSLLTFTDEHGAFWLAPVVLFVVMLTVAVLVVLRQHTMLGARLEGLRFAAALGLVALAAALLLRIAAESSASGGGFGAEAGATATFNPFLAAFVLALWGAVTGLLAPVVAAALPSGLVQSVRRRLGMAPVPPPTPVPAPYLPPAPPQAW